VVTINYTMDALPANITFLGKDHTLVPTLHYALTATVANVAFQGKQHTLTYTNNEVVPVYYGGKGFIHSERDYFKPY